MQKRVNILFYVVLVIAINIMPTTAFAYDNPLFVTITSECCSTCQKLKPVLGELENEYNGQVTFVTLNVSSRSSLEEAKQKANEYGFTEFYESNKNAVPKVGILCPGGKAENIFTGETRKEIYEEALDKLLSDINQICSL